MREIILIPAVGTPIGRLLRRNPFIVLIAIQLLDLILLSFSKGEGRYYKSLMNNAGTTSSLHPCSSIGNTPRAKNTFDERGLCAVPLLMERLGEVEKLKK